MRLLALLAAVIAAALLPRAPMGINVLLVAVFVALTAATAVPRTVDAWMFGALALALAAVPAWRDAGWVVAVALVAAVILAAISVAGVRPFAAVAPIRALGDAPQLLPSPAPAWLPAARGVLLGSILVLPFGGLFWTADAVFAELGGAVPVPSLVTLPARVVVFVVVLLLAIGLTLAARKPPADPELATPRSLSRAEWVIPLVLLNALFAVFVGVQLSVLFGGHRHVLETAGLSYSEYARQGFWQLIVAATLTLVVIAVAFRLSSARTRSDRLVLHALTGMLCALTLLIVASALRRLELYDEAFGLTRSRLAAETVTLALGAFFALILLAGVVRTVRVHFARIAVAGAAVGLLVFALSNPDGRVADRNVERWRETGDLDVGYSRSLSADAVPALDALPEPIRGVVLAPFSARLEKPDPLASWNRGRARARELLSGSGAEGRGAQMSRR